MTKRVLITGGAGFIGSHLADLLIENSDYDITIFDSLDTQVHGKTARGRLQRNHSPQGNGNGGRRRN